MEDNRSSLTYALKIARTWLYPKPPTTFNKSSVPKVEGKILTRVTPNVSRNLSQTYRPRRKYLQTVFCKEAYLGNGLMCPVRFGGLIVVDATFHLSNPAGPSEPARSNGLDLRQHKVTNLKASSWQHHISPRPFLNIGKKSDIDPPSKYSKR